MTTQAPAVPVTWQVKHALLSSALFPPGQEAPIPPAVHHSIQYQAASAAFVPTPKESPKNATATTIETNRLFMFDLQSEWNGETRQQNIEWLPEAVISIVAIAKRTKCQPGPVATPNIKLGGSDDQSAVA
jgi:hypothetical protein